MTTKIRRGPRSDARNPYLKRGAPSRVTFTIGAEAGNVINVGIQVSDPNNNDLPNRGCLRAFLSADANGDSLVPAYDMPTSIAIGTDGLLIPGETPKTALLVGGALAIHSTPEQFVTGAISEYLVNRRYKTKAATTGLTFTANHVVTASLYGIILVQINAAGTISTKVPSATQAYTSAALALAALPAPDTDCVPLGYIAIANNAGDWTANTDDLTNGSDLTTATFTNFTDNGMVSPVFDLVSESDGDIDINITQTRVKTHYLVVVTPDGKLWPSGAIAFA